MRAGTESDPIETDGRESDKNEEEVFGKEVLGSDPSFFSLPPQLTTRVRVSSSKTPYYTLSFTLTLEEESTLSPILLPFLH